MCERMLEGGREGGHFYIYIYSFSRRFYPKRLPRVRDKRKEGEKEGRNEIQEGFTSLHLLNLSTHTPFPRYMNDVCVCESGL